MNIVIAPDSFKEGLTSIKVANTILKGLKKINRNNNYFIVPISDGGEGFLHAITENRKKVVVTGPLGKKIKSEIGFLDNNKTIIIEMALACGFEQVKENKKDPHYTTTYGLGELILEALKYRPNKIVIGLGGTATNDLGLGALQALGVKFYNKDKKEVGIFGKDLLDIDDIDISNMNQELLNVELILATDVNNLLTGKSGATYTYGPQKGLKEEDLKIFDDQFLKVGKLLSKKAGNDFIEEEGSGAAGGIGFSLNILFNGKFKKGFNLVSELLNLKEKFLKADIVITGEGKMDGQTLNNHKAVFLVADKAKKINKDIKVIAFTGTNLLKEKSIFDKIIEINNPKLSLKQNIKRTKRHLKLSIKQLKEYI